MNFDLLGDFVRADGVIRGWAFRTETTNSHEGYTKEERTTNQTKNHDSVGSEDLTADDADQDGYENDFADLL